MKLLDGPIAFAVVLAAGSVLAVAAVLGVLDSRRARSAARCLLAIAVPLVLATLAVTILRFGTVQ